MTSLATLSFATGFSNNNQKRVTSGIGGSEFLGLASISKGTENGGNLRVWSSGLTQKSLQVVRAAVSDNGSEKKKKKSGTKGKVVIDKDSEAQPSIATVTSEQPQQSPPSVSRISLDDVNPVGLGRKSRQIFDEVWRKFSGLGQISRTTRADDDNIDTLLIREGPMCEFVTPGAQNTTVLVVGATSRIGTIVIRKLMLRGYTVKALVRKADPDIVGMLPRSVEIVVGDVGEPATLKAAVEGCNKIIYCATARSTITGDLNRVDHLGVYNITKALQVTKRFTIFDKAISLELVKLSEL
ncbi:hypothetical protein QQ045_017108 [Rhodiola kirilowii]